MKALLCASLTLGTAAAFAQSAEDLSRQRAAAQQLIEAEAAATANAARPGDDALSCEALQAEIVAIAQSSQMQTFSQVAGQQAQTDLAQIQAAQQAAQEQAAQARPRFGQLVRGLASGVVPGADRAAAAAQQAAAAAQVADAQARAAENSERIVALSGEAAVMAGPAMRGARLFELGRAKNCAWVEEFGGAPAAAPLQPSR